MPKKGQQEKKIFLYIQQGQINHLLMNKSFTVYNWNETMERYNGAKHTLFTISYTFQIKKLKRFFKYNIM